VSRGKPGIAQKETSGEELITHYHNACRNKYVVEKQNQLGIVSGGLGKRGDRNGQN
jgi:hypothetical protein